MKKQLIILICVAILTNFVRFNKIYGQNTGNAHYLLFYAPLGTDAITSENSGYIQKLNVYDNPKHLYDIFLKYISLKDALVWIASEDRIIYGKIKLPIDSSQFNAVGYCIIEIETTVPIPDGYFIISYAPFPKQEWKNVILNKNDSLFINDYINKKDLSIEKEKKMSYPDSVVLSGENDNNRFYHVVGKNNEEFLIIEHETPFIWYIDAGEFVPVACWFFKRENGQWKRIQEENNFEVASCMPLIDIDGDGVPEIVYGAQFGCRLFKFYKEIKRDFNIISDPGF